LLGIATPRDLQVLQIKQRWPTALASTGQFESSNLRAH
jgi:hypothetical protein